MHENANTFEALSEGFLLKPINQKSSSTTNSTNTSGTKFRHQRFSEHNPILNLNVRETRKMKTGRKRIKKRTLKDAILAWK